MMNKLLMHLDSLFRNFNIPSEEQFRITKVLENHPDVNWVDALGNSQLKSKKWLIDHLEIYSTPETNIVMIGGWVGLIQYLMDNKNVKYKSNLNIDIDHASCMASLSLNNLSADLGKYSITTTDAYEFDYTKLVKPFLVINTSCEHLDHFSDWIKRIPEGTTFILQSNNMFGIPLHVNCKDTLKEFIFECNLRKIHFADEIDIGDGWKRFMIIGDN